MMSRTTPEPEQIAIVTHISPTSEPRESADPGSSTASQCGATTSAVNSRTDTTLDNILCEVRSLVRILERFSEQRFGGDGKRSPILPESTVESVIHTNRPETDWKSKVEGQYRLLSRPDDERSLDRCKKSCQFNWRFAHYGGPVLRLRLRPEGERENSACETLDIPRVADGPTCSDPTVLKLREHIQKHWTTSIAGSQVLEDRAIQYYPRNMVSSHVHYSSRHPRRSIRFYTYIRPYL